MTSLHIPLIHRTSFTTGSFGHRSPPSQKTASPCGCIQGKYAGTDSQGRPARRQTPPGHHLRPLLTSTELKHPGPETGPPPPPAALENRPPDSPRVKSVGIEGGFYPNFCSDAKNAPKSTKEFYPTHRIETKSKPSENRQTGDWDPQNGPDYIKMLA